MQLNVYVILATTAFSTAMRIPGKRLAILGVA